MGDNTLCEDDLLNCRKFKDSITLGTYDIDIHNPAVTGTVIKEIPADYYTIPLRAAIPAGADNLVCCWRSLSSTHEAHSSFRVMPITTIIGGGVEYAATIALKNKIPLRHASSDELHHLMDAHKALY